MKKNPLDRFKEHTQARIGLERIGHSLSTRDLLDYQVAHALARDAVLEKWNVLDFEKRLKKLGEKPLLVKTRVSIREQYLKYPSLGRGLCEASRDKLIRYSKRHQADIVFIISDGLSSKAIDAHMVPFWRILKPLLSSELGDLKIALVIAPFGRVALSDDVGCALNAKVSVICVGERPGLSSVDSLGIYLTYAPKRTNTDANRNCISNVHPPQGLSYVLAAEKLIYLISESMRRKVSGVELKEDDGLLPEHLISRIGSVHVL